MCGLVSIVSKQKNGIYHSDMKVFTEMLFADQLRGSDGTGVIYNKGKEIKTLKAPVASSDFVNDEAYDKAVKEAIASGNFVVGHNRAATKGKLNHTNTHPFREGHITLVHNGTLPYHKGLADVEVDSHAICISMAKRGHKETIKAIQGAFALIWVDNKAKTLNFIRNRERPLWVVETKDLFIFVSEQGLARWICGRNHIDILTVTEVPVNTLHSFEFGKWEKMNITPMDVYIPPPFVPHTYNNSAYKPPALISEKVITTDARVSDLISYVPIDIDKDSKNKIIGEWEDSITGEVIEVRFWARNPEEALLLLKEKTLRGHISAKAYQPAVKSLYIIMRDSYPEPKYVKKELKSNNNVTLTKLEFDSMETKCSCCNVHYSRMFLSENIKDCNVEFIPTGEISFTCPDCTSWLERYDDNLAFKGV